MDNIEWEALNTAVAECRKCSLCKYRQQVVIGDGCVTSPLMIVGEGPGAEEDRLGKPFVGPAGKLLDKMLLSIGLERTEVYIANIVKCRPPQNRTPTQAEAQACYEYLERQIALVAPRVILCMGTPAAMRLIDVSMRVSRDRGTVHEADGRKLVPTYHPAALLRDSSHLMDAWRDMQLVKRLLEGQNE